MKHSSFHGPTRTMGALAWIFALATYHVAPLFGWNRAGRSKAPPAR
jgi:hypothetical protein